MSIFFPMGILITPPYCVSVVVIVVVNWPVPKATSSTLVEQVTSTPVSPSSPTPINNLSPPTPTPYCVSVVVVVVVICSVPMPNPTPAPIS